ncbi:MAG: DUF2188 domain-containing protein [Rhodospirillales bacterium]|nr:DUF2188 domain-containing protein [Rhodospirillales bacterium]
MLGRHVYRITPDEEGLWVVSKDGVTAPLGRKDTRDEALRLACDLAERDQPSRVVVEPGDGTISEERTYGADTADVR